MMKTRTVIYPIIVRYTLLGVGFGFLFPVLGTIFQIILDRLSINISSIFLGNVSLSARKNTQT